MSSLASTSTVQSSKAATSQFDPLETPYHSVLVGLVSYADEPTTEDDDILSEVSSERTLTSDPVEQEEALGSATDPVVLPGDRSAHSDDDQLADDDTVASPATLLRLRGGGDEAEDGRENGESQDDRQEGNDEPEVADPPPAVRQSKRSAAPEETKSAPSRKKRTRERAVTLGCECGQFKWLISLG